MFFDAEQRTDDWFKDTTFDVCICGSGPAGITLARKLAALGWRVALCESGGFDIKHEAQDLNAGRVVGLDYYPLETARMRVLGGTSGHWNGVMWPLDAHDFEAIPHHQSSGWPIKKSDLDAFADEAMNILDLVPAKDESDLETSDIFRGAADPLRPVTRHRSEPVTRFGGKYRTELQQSKIFAYLNATLVDIRLDPGLRAVSSAVFRSYERPETFAITARYFVLCLGGIENARVLLNSNGQMNVGIGNQHDLVGRFFCEHPHFYVGSPVFRSQPRAVSSYTLSQRAIREQKCLNFVLHTKFPPDAPLTARGFAREAACLTPFSRWLVGKLLGRPPLCTAWLNGLYGGFEQALNRDSRVLLSNELDGFGKRRVALDWRLTDLDYHTMRVAVMEYGRRVAATDVGRVQIVEWLRTPTATPPGIDKDFVAGFHHMCTTRMSDDPRTGVVDRDCLVHGLGNLFIGGSSVFATALGYKTPTYVIVALALRLAGHLDGRLRHH